MSYHAEYAVQVWQMCIAWRMSLTIITHLRKQILKLLKYLIYIPCSTGSRSCAAFGFTLVRCETSSISEKTSSSTTKRKSGYFEKKKIIKLSMRLSDWQYKVMARNNLSTITRITRYNSPPKRVVKFKGLSVKRLSLSGS